VKEIKTHTSKKERKESKNPDTTGNMRQEIPEYLGTGSAKERKIVERFMC
jgi:hypothetical protein